METCSWGESNNGASEQSSFDTEHPPVLGLIDLNGRSRQNGLTGRMYYASVVTTATRNTIAMLPGTYERNMHDVDFET